MPKAAKENWLLIYYTITVIFFEALYALFTNKSIGADFIFPIMFSITIGSFMYLISRLFSKKVNMIIAFFFTSVSIIIYISYLIYFQIFKVPLSLYSITGAKDAFQFREVLISAIRSNLMAVLLYILPVIFLIYASKILTFEKMRKNTMFFSVSLIVLSSVISLLAVNMTKDRPNSQYMLYYKAASLQLSVTKLGLFTTIRLDLKRLIDKPVTKETVVETTVIQTTIIETTKAAALIKPTTEVIGPEYNMLDIDFDELIQNENDDVIKDMHKYFSTQEPTMQNEYTGMFKGNNLIFIVAEAFFPYAVHKELTPALYMMSNEGFVFNNYYNPLFDVSTSDGEYTALQSLLPKPGVWSFYISSRNYLPFVFGNQFKNIGYTTKAYHDHTYTYYNRDRSHPNMGYDYKGIGNGLDIKVTWPESDLEMIQATTDEYINNEPFHVYYLTVSGHLQYNFGGNEMAKKNRDKVKDLPYSNEAKAYIACNMEFEFAMEELIKRLDKEGVLENTVIAICPDHYPYGLQKSSIDELSGHKVESNFELHKGIFILWKKGMEKVVVDKICSSVDINPTLSNLFALDYDSRLLMGKDILSDAPKLVIFANRSWITDIARYDSITNKAEFFIHDQIDEDYVRSIHDIAANKFKYSIKILENNYYDKLQLKQITK